LTNSLAHTRWGAIAALFFAGCTLALHVGKFPAALPLLVDEFTLSLSQSGNLVSIYALLIASCALLLGVAVSRFGYVLFAITGLGLCVAGSLVGMLTDNATILMWSRACEGFGWIFGVVAFPTLFTSLCLLKDRPVVLGIWGAFMPIGGGSMMLITPLLQNIHSWRLVWAVSAFLTIVGLIVLMGVISKNKDALLTVKPNAVPVNFKDLKKPESVAALVCFGVYSFLYLGCTSFLPLQLVEESGLQYSTAVYWATLVMIFNAIGNIASGWLINRGYTRSGLIVFASLTSGLLAVVIFAVPEPSIRIASALLLTAISGLIPGTLFSSAPLISSSAAGVGVIVGFMLTGTGIGQLTGPFVVSRVVELFGNWYTGGMVCLGVALLGVVFGRKLRSID